MTAFFMGFWKSRSECIQILTDVIIVVAENLIEQSYWYLNVNSNASHTEGFDLVPSWAVQIMKKSVTQCLHSTNDSWHFVFLFLHTDEEAAWLSSGEWTASCQRCRKSKRVEEQMCVYGGGPFDYGTVNVHVVSSAWLMTPLFQLLQTFDFSSGPETHQLSEAGTETRVPWGL